MQSTLKVACLTALLLVLAGLPGTREVPLAHTSFITAGDDSKTGSGTG